MWPGHMTMLSYYIVRRRTILFQNHRPVQSINQSQVSGNSEDQSQVLGNFEKGGGGPKIVN